MNLGPTLNPSKPGYESLKRLFLSPTRRASHPSPLIRGFRPPLKRGDRGGQLAGGGVELQ